jgi:aconitate hydratase
VCPGSRQTLEVLAEGALADLIATGARLIEPDSRVLSGALYPPAPGGLSLKTCDHTSQRRGTIVSAETLAYAVAHGELGDPRGFKRPVRITVPRNLPTDDVLLIRGAEARGGAKGKGRVDHRAADLGDSPPPSERFSSPIEPRTWEDAIELAILAERSDPSSPSVFVAETLDDIRWLAERATTIPELRAVIAPHIPSAMVSVLSGLGVLALRADGEALRRLAKAKSLSVPAQETWEGAKVALGLDAETVAVDWLAVGSERDFSTRS